jgi:hypothetical protein
MTDDGRAIGGLPPAAGPGSIPLDSGINMQQNPQKTTT